MRPDSLAYFSTDALTPDAQLAHLIIVPPREESALLVPTAIQLSVRQHVLIAGMERSQDLKSVKLQLSAALQTHDVSLDALHVQTDTLQIQIKFANTAEMDQFNLQKKLAI